MLESLNEHSFCLCRKQQQQQQQKPYLIVSPALLLNTATKTLVILVDLAGKCY